MKASQLCWLVCVLGLVLSSCADISPQLGEEDVAFEGLTFIRPADSLPFEANLTLEKPPLLPPASSGMKQLGVAVEMSAGGHQPITPLTVTVDAGSFGPSDPNAVVFARWDDEIKVWVPYRTEFDEAAGKIVARVDHFSIGSFFEYLGESMREFTGGVGDVFIGTGRQAKEFSSGIVSVTTSAVSSLAASANLLATNVSGWLGVRGAHPPICGTSDTPDSTESFDLMNQHSGAQPPLFACIEEEGQDLVVRIANNRPYGMVLTPPPDAQMHLESWPDIALVSGQSGAVAFFEILSLASGRNEFYVPPGATVVATLRAATVDIASFETMATAAFVGLDLATEALLTAAGRADNGLELMRSGSKCVLGTGGTLTELAHGPQADDVLRYLDGFSTCVGGLLGDSVKAGIAAGPSLVSIIRDLGASGTAASGITVSRRLPSPVPITSPSDLGKSFLHEVLWPGSTAWQDLIAQNAWDMTGPGQLEPVIFDSGPLRAAVRDLQSSLPARSLVEAIALPAGVELPELGTGCQYSGDAHVNCQYAAGNRTITVSLTPQADESGYRVDGMYEVGTQ